MAEIGKAYVQIIPKAPGISGQINSLLAPGSKTAGEKAGSTIGSGIKKAIVAAGIGTVVVKTLKSALSEGAKLEQSYGGLETIYGKASDQAIRFAKNAAKAGISANNYAEQAVSFGASLKQAFGGDTEKAVKAANTAILDMTDNAAKMGTPIENIQNAYQGFAKQNYTMLDNLKLGYGGTKTEMERLLKDAQKLSGQKYDISNLGDVYEAIHVIQGELGLTGVAAKEASETFEGSFNAMKANWKNLLGELALGGDEVGPMMAEFAESAATFLFDNFIPMVGNVMKGLPDAIVTAIQVGAPKLMEAGKALLTGIMNGVKTYAPMLIESIPGMIKSLQDGLDTYIPMLMEKGGSILKSIGQGIITYGPQIAATLGQALQSMINYISQRLPEWAAKGGELLKSLVKGFIQHIPDMLEALAKLIKWIVPNLGKLALTLVKSGAELLKAIAQGLAEGIASIIGPVMDNIVSAIKTPINGIKSFLSSAWSSIKSTAAKAWDGIKSVISKAWSGIKSVSQKAANGLKSSMSTAFNGIKAMTSPIWEGIKKAMAKPIEGAKTLIKATIDKIKSIFPFNLGKICHLQIPKIDISGGKAPWGIGGKGKKPSFSVHWAAQGGIVDGATLIGAGEAGAEAIVPLDPFWKKIDKLAENMTGGGDVFNVTLAYDAGDDANDMLRDLARGIKRYRRAGAF